MTETSTSSKRSIPKLVGYFVAIVVLVVIDQWTKALVLRDLAGGRTVTPLPGILQFRYVENTGAAFSVLTGRTLFLAVITALVLCIAIGLLALEKIPGVLNQVAVLLMVAGGFGNLIDRVSRHYVVDFIEVLFTRFAVFNFADCCVTIGAVILILSTILSFVKDVKSSRD
jgi:signal peptidase II